MVTKATVTPTGTMKRVSPRSADNLPPEDAARLKAARDKRAAAEAEFKSQVIAALRKGSVRAVAKAAGLSPTTVIAWSKDR